MPGRPAKSAVVNGVRKVPQCPLKSTASLSATTTSTIRRYAKRRSTRRRIAAVLAA
jgi:hypothetical protein